LDLSDVTEQLKNVELETLRVAEERDETVKMSNAHETLAEAKKQQEVTTRVLSCSLFA
jgi:hypothetical protein